MKLHHGIFQQVFHIAAENTGQLVENVCLRLVNAIDPLFIHLNVAQIHAGLLCKGNTWHFGYKAHIGVDKDSGLVHTVEATAANVHDVAEVPKLLTGEEETVYGDSGYLGAGKREDAVVRNKSGRKIKYKINRRPSQMKKLSKSRQYAAKEAERAKSSVRAKVEHVFGVVKKQLHFRKTRYRGLEKQQAKFNIMFALANLILADRPCLAA